ncbi:MAG: EFR1 family ferrodoxin [Promethearchaeota archaeon]
MVKILILHFSGTGNTAFIGRYLASHLTSQLGHLEVEITKASIETTPVEQLKEYELIVFGFPVFELSAPQIVHEYLDQIPHVESKGVFLFCTMGLAAGNAIRKVFAYFNIKGFNFLGYAKMKMPGTDGLAMLNEDSSYVKKALQRNYEEIQSADALIHQIVSVVKDLEKGGDLGQYHESPPINFLDSVFGWILHLIYVVMVKYMKKRYWVDNSCNKCNLCVKICPVGNITMEPSGIQFHDHCVVCLRCVHQCPQQAIQIGKFTKGKFRWHGPQGKYHPPILR